MFHVYYPGEGKNGYYLRYDGEATLEDIIDSICNDPVKPKTECPGIILNRFKPYESRNGPTIRNRYADLEYTTGYFALDVDNIGPMTNLIRKILFGLPEVIVSWISSSGNGVKAIGYSPKLINQTPRMFSMKYRILCGELRMKSGMRINFDQAMGRCHQPVFINSDPNALYKTKKQIYDTLH
jgi:hypothetical protein